MKELILLLFSTTFILGFIWLYKEYFGDDSFYITMEGNYFHRGDIITTGNGVLLRVLSSGDSILKVKPFKP